MRPLLLGALLLTLLACTPESDEAPVGTPSPQGPSQRILAEIGAVLGADPVDTEVERIRPRECPADYDRTDAVASFDGVRISVSRTFGACPRSHGGYFACRGVPDRPGHAVDLRDCLTRTAEGGDLVVAGRLVVYQESESLLAVVGEPDRQCVLGTDVDSGLDLETLVGLAEEIRCE